MTERQLAYGQNAATHSTFGLVPCDAIQLSRSDFIAGLRADRLTAPGCLDQAMTGESFKEYLRSQLGPTLKPGDSVICDNLPAHKVAEVQAIIEAHGRRSNTGRLTVPT
jgi:transposase